MKIHTQNEIKKIYNLLIKNKYEDPETEIEYLYYGLWYREHGDYDNAKKYYLMAIKHGNMSAMTNLGYYYYDNADYKNAIKYYSIYATNTGNQKMYIKTFNK